MLLFSLFISTNMVQCIPFAHVYQRTVIISAATSRLAGRFQCLLETELRFRVQESAPSGMSWSSGQCPFFYTSHYTPSLSANTTGLSAADAVTPIPLGATGMGTDASQVSITVQDARLGLFPAQTLAVSNSTVQFATGPQVYGNRKQMAINVAGLGDAMVTQPGGPLLPEISVCHAHFHVCPDFAVAEAEVSLFFSLPQRAFCVMLGDITELLMPRAPVLEFLIGRQCVLPGFAVRCSGNMAQPADPVQELAGWQRSGHAAY